MLFRSVSPRDPLGQTEGGGELNWKETWVGERMPRRHPRLPFMLHPAKPLTNSRVCLRHSISRPNKLLWQYSLKKFPSPRTRPELPGPPVIAHQDWVPGMQMRYRCVKMWTLSAQEAASLGQRQPGQPLVTGRAGLIRVLER